MRTRWIVVLWGLVVMTAGCNGGGQLGATCSSSSECGDGLMCRTSAPDGILMGQCTASCSSSASCRSRFGEHSFCIGAGLCVAECSRTEECPAFTECSSFDWCSR